MNKNLPDTPDIPSQFHAPEGWQWGAFTRGARRLRYGWCLPADGKPEAHVICLPGLGEFIEKYFETARTILDLHMSVTVLDWMGQGKSARYFPDEPQKRHGTDFKEDMADLESLISNVLPFVLPDYDAAKQIMLAHSTGANIGLQYLHANPRHFCFSMLSAPLLGIPVLEKIPSPLCSGLLSLMKRFSSRLYVPGGKNWHAAMREPAGQDLFSTDPVRGSIHNAWCLADPSLQTGAPTNGWLYHAYRACQKVSSATFLKSITTPLLIAKAENDRIVSNHKIDFAVRHLPHADLINLPGARHEILVERDEVRDPLFESFAIHAKRACGSVK